MKWERQEGVPLLQLKSLKNLLKGILKKKEAIVPSQWKVHLEQKYSVEICGHKRVSDPDISTMLGSVPVHVWLENLKAYLESHRGIQMERETVSKEILKYMLKS